MKKFRLVFYIPDKKDGSHIDDLIGGWTIFLNRIGSVATLDFDRLKVLKTLYSSHEELWLPDEVGDFDSFPKAEYFYGNSWTSTMGQIGGKSRTGSGVCCRLASEVFKNPERWFYAEFEVSDFGYHEMLTMMKVELEANKGYDVQMILNFFLPLGIGEKDKWICSEFTNYMAKIALRGRTNHKQYAAIVETLKDTMSPLRSAWTLARQGVFMYNLDGSVRYGLE